MRNRINAALLLGSAAIAVCVGIGSASAHDWNGFYAGLNVGAGFATQNWSNLVVPSDTYYGRPGEEIGRGQSPGFVYGGQVGYNDQMGNWVFGLEASIDGANNGSSFDCFGGGGDYVGNCGTSSHWNADFTGRVGAVLNGALFYAKAGGELRDLTAHARDVTYIYECCYNAGSYHNSSNTPFGWIVGVGAEFGLCDDMSAALEYDYSAEEATADFVPLAGSDTEIVLPYHVNVSQRTSTVTFRLNYKLDL